MKRVKLVRIFAVTAIVYVAGYIAFRLDGTLVHFEIRAVEKKGHEIRVPVDGFTEVAEEMAEESGNPGLIGYAAWPSICNRVFAPLRSLEAAFWNWSD
ncbi:MAG: hypothetical protein KDN19_02965 [Verrucomicrobiae bacterium]|nr:hypothetical protein [Verrucomicrobiae bacterium]